MKSARPPFGMPKILLNPSQRMHIPATVLAPRDGTMHYKHVPCVFFEVQRISPPLLYSYPNTPYDSLLQARGERIRNQARKAD